MSEFNHSPCAVPNLDSRAAWFRSCQRCLAVGVACVVEKCRPVGHRAASRTRPMADDMEIAGSPIELLNIPLKSWIKNGTP